MARVLKGGLAILAASLLALTWFAGCVAWSLRPPPPLSTPETGLDLRDVTVVVPGGGRREHVRLVVEGERIASLGPAEPADDDPYAGVYVLPGLTDMHVHWPPDAIPGQVELFALLHLAHGVTTVRVLGEGVFGEAPGEAREAVVAGRIPGPRVLSCGPIVDGDPPLWRGSLVVRDAEEARAAVVRIVEAGHACVKAYDSLGAPALAGLRDEAHARDLALVGHVPFAVARLDDVQHLRGVHPPLRPGDAREYPFFLTAWERMDAARTRAIVSWSLEHDIAHTPTLVTVDRLARSADYADMVSAPAYRLLPRWYRDALWDARIGLNGARRLAPSGFGTIRTALSRMRETVGALHAAGVRIHSGTDTMAPAVVPGAGLHRELELFVESGLSPEEALEISMRISPDYLGIPGLGEVRPGAPAELVLLREDPTRDLAALRSIAGVVRGGRLYPRARLDEGVARQRAAFERFGQRVLLTEAARLALGWLLPLLFASTQFDGEGA